MVVPVVPSGSDQDVALVLRAYDAYAHGDIEQAVAAMHPDVEWIEPDAFPNGGRRQGPAAVAEYLRASRSAWAELVSRPTPYRLGEKVVIVHQVSGRMIDGSMPEVTVADVFTVTDGRIVRMKAYADPAEAFALES